MIVNSSIYLPLGDRSPEGGPGWRNGCHVRALCLGRTWDVTLKKGGTGDLYGSFQVDLVGFNAIQWDFNGILMGCNEI